MVRINIKPIISFLFCCQFITAHSQPIPGPDTENIINGKLWVPTPVVAKGSPFFFNTRNLKGDLLFDGTWFKNQDCVYDNLKDEVIATVQTTDNTKKNIVLNRSLLEGFRFKISGQLYFFLRGDKINRMLDANSYYQVHIAKELTYVIKWGKKRKISSSEKIGFEYVEVNELLLIIDNRIERISSKKRFLLALKEKKGELKKFIRKNKLKIQPKTPLNLIPVIEYFDSLKKKDQNFAP